MTIFAPTHIPTNISGGSRPQAVVKQTISGHNFLEMCHNGNNGDPYACVRAAARRLRRLQLAACNAGCLPATDRLMPNNPRRSRYHRIRLIFVHDRKNRYAAWISFWTAYLCLTFTYRFLSQFSTNTYRRIWEKPLQAGVQQAMENGLRSCLS